MMRRRAWTLVSYFALGGLVYFAAPTQAAAQIGFVSGGFMSDIKRYASGSAGLQVYDGTAAGGFLGAGVFVTKRFSAEFEMGLSSDSTTSVSTPVIVSGSTVNFTTTFATRLQTYSALFAVHIQPSSRLHLSFRGGATLIHHRRLIVPPQLVPPNPETNTTPMTTTVIENVASPIAGVDADVVLSPRLALVGALRVNTYTVATDLSAYSIRPMIGARLLF
jgi:hypothetical protein